VSNKKKVLSCRRSYIGDGDGPIGIKAGLHEQRALLQPLFRGEVGDTFLGKILGPSQEDTRQVVIRVEVRSKMEKDKSTQGK